MPSRFYHDRIITPVLSLLKQGISPEKIAMGISFGIIIGVFPIVGITSVLCVFVAFIFRLNHAMIQLFNWLVYPLQIVLVIPFFRLGSYMFGTESLTMTVHHIIESYRTDFWGSLFSLWDLTLHATIAWLVAGIPLAAALYLLLAPLLRKKLTGIMDNT